MLQNPGLHELHQMQRELSQRCNGHMMRGFSGDIDTASHQLPPYAMLDDKLYGSGPQLPLAANPNALRKQSLNLDDIPHLPKPQPPPRREVRRPPISAFQSAATQDCKALNCQQQQKAGELNTGASKRMSYPPQDLVEAANCFTSCNVAVVRL